MKKPILTLALVSLITACGGGGGGGGDDPTPPNNITDQPTGNSGQPEQPSEQITGGDGTDHPHMSNFFGDQDLTEFFAFFDHRNVNVIEFAITEEEWQAMLDRLEVNLSSDEYAKGSVTLKTRLGDTTITEAGIRIRGNTTRQIPQSSGGGLMPVHYKIKFNEEFDLQEGSVEELERKERRFANLRSIDLKSRAVSQDQSQIRELYSYDLFNEAGIAAPLTGSARLILKIGDRPSFDYGIYTMIEPIDKAFLRKRYGDDDNEGNLYKCLWQWGGPANLAHKPSWAPDERWIGFEETLENGTQNMVPTYQVKTNKEAFNTQDLRDFIDQLNALEGDEFASYIDSVFNVDDFLRFLAMNVLIGMPDDYWAMGNNYYLYFNNNGKITFIPYDYDHGLGGGWQPFATESASIYEWENLMAQFEQSNLPFNEIQPLVDKILAVDDYLDQYLMYLDEYTAEMGLFSYARYENKFELLKSLYDPDNNGRVDNDLNQGEEMGGTVVRNGTSMIEVEQYFKNRIASVRRQL